MAGRIYPKQIKGNTYYYYQESYRRKIEPTAYGKHRGSGKSQVHTKSIYLGEAARPRQSQDNIYKVAMPNRSDKALNQKLRARFRFIFC